MSENLKEEIKMPKQPKWKSFSEEEIRKIVAEAFSDREVARKLG